MPKTKKQIEKPIYRSEYPTYSRVTEYKTNKKIIINNRRILFAKEKSEDKILIIMNSGFKVVINKNIDDFWQHNLCVSKLINPEKIIIKKSKKK